MEMLLTVKLPVPVLVMTNALLWVPPKKTPPKSVLSTLFGVLSPFAITSPFPETDITPRGLQLEGRRDGACTQNGARGVVVNPAVVAVPPQPTMVAVR